MLQFLKKTKFNNLPFKFCKSMQRLWSMSKKTIFLQVPINILSGRTSYEGAWGGCLLNSPPYICRLFLNSVFLRWRLKTSGHISPVQFSCTKKLLMKLEVTSATMPLMKTLLFDFQLNFLHDRLKQIYHERYGISSVCF